MAVTNPLPLALALPNGAGFGAAGWIERKDGQI